MPLAKIKKNFQVTIPKGYREKIKIAVGDYVEIENINDSLVLKPVQFYRPDQAYKPSVPRLSKEEQRVLAEAKKKIDKINADLIHSVGLNNKEIKVVAKAGLIDPEQAYWWHEDWQKGEREAERDIAEGRYKEFDNAEDLIKGLHSK